MPRLDGLRGLAALAVVCLHVWMYTDANDAGHSVLLDAVVGEFRVAVGLFFVLSGFLLARPWLAAARGERPLPGLGTFALRRVARIGPAYWVALLGAVPAVRRHRPRARGERSRPADLRAFQQNSFSETRSKLDPPMWSLGVEVAFYVALPLIGWLLIPAAARAPHRRGPLLVCAAARGRARVDLPRRARRLVARDDVDAADLPAAVRVRDRGGRGGGVRAPGRWLGRRCWPPVCAGGRNGLWHATGTAFSGTSDRPAGRSRLRGDRRGGRDASAGLLATARCARSARCPTASTCGTCRCCCAGLHGSFPTHAAEALPAVLGPTLVLAALSWWLVERPVLRRVARGGRRERVVRPRTRVGVPAAAPADSWIRP